MKERPILMSAAMVRAILEGRKTQTRQVIPVQPSQADMKIARVTEGPRDRVGKLFWAMDRGQGWDNEYFSCQYGQPGDRLWVRETWAARPEQDNLPPSECDDTGIWWRASLSAVPAGYEACHGKWRPSIHMPRWASRITLEITGVRVERLQDITNNDALEEGTPDLRTIENGWDMRRCFQELWEQINGAGSWSKNPWVWVIEFKKV